MVEIQTHPEFTPQSLDANAQTLRILRSASEIDSIRAFWSASLGTRDSDIDILFDEGLSDDSEAPQPRVVVLYRGEQPVALAAGQILRTELALRLGYFRLFRRKVNVLTVPYGGVRGETSLPNCRSLVRGIIKCLKNGEADVAVLQYVNANSALCCCAKTEPHFLLRDHFTPLRPHRKRTLRDVHKGTSPGASQLRRVARKLSREFADQIRVEALESPYHLERALATVEQIAKKAWQRRTSSIGFDITNASLMNALKRQAEKGYLRVYILYLGGKPCAFWIGAVYQGTFYSDFLGYDPDYAQFSPGTYLLSQMMEKLCSCGVEEIDFGFSDEEYKKRFSNITWQDTSVHIFAPSWLGFKLSAMRMVTVLLNETARAVLTGTNLYQKSKMVWRRTARKSA